MLVSFENVCFGFSGNSLLENICFTLSEGDRVGLIGANGEGKTTLLRLILSELDAESGSVFKKNGIRIGYLQQNGGYDSCHTVWDEMQSIFDEDRKAVQDLRIVEEKIAQAREGTDDYRALAARYEALNKKIAARDSYHYEIRIKTVLNGMGFGACYEQQISTMSGGEKTRLKLCRLLLEDPELLILDEPTNHLDIASREWIEAAIDEFEGALLFVSHDRYFIEKFAQRIWVLEDGMIKDYPCGYEKYRSILEKEAIHRALPVAAEKPKKEKPKGGTKEVDKLIRRLEREIEKQEQLIAELDDKISKNGADYQELTKLLQEKEKEEERLLDLMEQWEVAQS